MNPTIATPPATDTLTTIVRGYADYLDDAGRWVASSGPPARAAYLRQWRIENDRKSPGEVLALHVRVRRLDAASHPRDDGVWLSAMRVRTRR